MAAIHEVLFKLAYDELFEPVISASPAQASAAQLTKKRIVAALEEAEATGKVQIPQHAIAINNATDELIAFCHLLRRRKRDLFLPKDTYYRRQYVKNRPMKARVAKAFADVITPGTSLACTEGSTVTRSIEALFQTCTDVSVVTNNMGVAELATEDLDIEMVGGRYLASAHACVGDQACRAFAEFNCNTVVIGVSGIGLDGELYVYHPEECRIRRAAIGSANRVVIVADGMKLGRIDRWHFANIRSLLETKDVTLITNRIAPPMGAAKQKIARQVLSSLGAIQPEVEAEVLGKSSQARKKLTIITAGDDMGLDQQKNGDAAVAKKQSGKSALSQADEPVPMKSRPAIETELTNLLEMSGLGGKVMDQLQDLLEAIQENVPASRCYRHWFAIQGWVADEGIDLESLAPKAMGFFERFAAPIDPAGS